MKKHYIVVILDVNSIPRDSPFNDDYDPGDGETEVGGDEDEGNKNRGGCIPLPYKYGMVKSIKETVLALLAKEALQYHTEKFDFSQVFWSIKLYNSSYEINSKTGRSFQPLGIESIDAFEKQLECFLDMGSQSALKSDPNVNHIQFLSTSLKSVLGDLPWPEATRGLDDRTGDDNRNVIHAMFRVPRSETEVQNFVSNWTPAAGSKSIMNELLPKAFCRKMKEHQIQLHFMDLESAFKCENGELMHLHDSDSDISKPMIKIASFLGGGVTRFTEISRGVPLGMPSYADLLKLLISANSQVVSGSLNGFTSKTDETQKTIHKLQGSMNGSVVNKISPTDDTDVESIRSHRIRIPTPSFALRRSFPEIKQVIQNRLPISIDDRRWVEHTRANDSRRVSDDREQLRRFNRNMPLPLHDEIPKKRKYEFEEDMESEEGYSPNDIENWCMGRTAAKEKHQPMRRAVVVGRNRSSSFNQKHTRHQHHVVKYVSPQITQPQKKIRRDREPEEIMAPPSRNLHSQATSSRQRYSDPTSTASYKSRADKDLTILRTTRGRAMVNEGLKKKVNMNRQKQKNERAAVEEIFTPQTNFWQENERILNSYKSRFQMMLKQPRSTGRAEEDPIDDLILRVKWFVEMVIREDDCCLPSTAQALVTTVGATLVDLQVRDLRDIMEKILFIPYADLNLAVIRQKNTEDEDIVFRKCYLQIFINFEMIWTVPLKDMAALEEQFIDDVTKILGLVRVYRKKPPIEDFVNDTLVPLYHPTHGRLLREIAATLNIQPSTILNASFDSPRSGSGSGRDDCSVSSFSSSMCGPDDSTSQHPNDNSFSQQSHQMNQSQHSLRTSLRTASFLSVSNPKRALMLPVSKLPTKPKIYQKSQSQSTQSGSLRPAKSPKPKKVRRNLFDVQASRDPKDMKMLLNLATSNASSFSRSPSLFKSPMSKHSCSPRSPGRPSPFFAAARARAAKSKGRSSRRRLIMDPDDDSSPHQRPGSGVWDESLLCPESPFTPKSNTRVQAASGSKHSSAKSVIHESPEVVKPASRGASTSRSFGNRRIDSVSFYSSGNESLKARAWERSGAKLMAAKIRDSVDLSQSLSLNDLEFVDSNSEEKNEVVDGSPAPCSSKNSSQHNSADVPTFENESSSIMALINSELNASSTDILNSCANLPPKSPGLDTPSKRVKFSLELVHTPSPTTPARSNCGIPVTPKSILKDAGSNHT